MNFSSDFSELFGFFLSRKVRFVIVGGHAVAVHAKPRYTKDVDVLVEPTPENAARLLAALDDFGFGGVGLTPDDFTKPGQVVQLGYPPNRVDILTSITGVSFDEVWNGHVEAAYGGKELPFIGRAELIRNKIASDRPQDRIDVEWLKKVTPSD